MKQFLFALFSTVLLVGCSNIKKLEKEYQLFQTGFDSLSNYSYKELTLKEGDKISIKAYTMATASQEQAGLFNVLGNNGIYIIDKNGKIELPKIGFLKVVGLTCKQLEELVTNAWSKYIKDISVNVQFQEFSVNVLGEVKSEGIKTFKTERVTILDAIAQSGGLSEDGKRSNVLVVREDNGQRKSYYMDLREANFYESPAFQLQQNDMIYVSANERKFKKMRDIEFRNNMQPLMQVVSISLSLINFFILLGRR
ncbi:MAG: polysaccharide export protein [Chitinophagaceae bacterium]|nr:polysaccharide export protein [Chitinophagaceae bacterium]MCW5905643.1 polysaccharide export protein [Chitinophagaceae bacterium]